MRGGDIITENRNILGRGFLMRVKHWKLLPGFLMGLVVMHTAAWCVGSAFEQNPQLLKMHWFLWLVLTLAMPLLALFLLGREKRSLFTMSYLVNALGAGCAFGVALGFLEVPVTERFGELLMSAAFPALTALVMCLLYTLWQRTRWIAMGFTFLVIPMVLGCMLFGRGHGVAALGGVFGFLFFAALPITCGKALSGEDWLEQLAFSGFGTYLIVLLGAIMLLVEDGIDGFEGIFDGLEDIGNGVTNNTPQKRRRP